MTKTRIFSVILLLIGFYLGFFVYNSEKVENSRFPFRYGLDLDGGTHLTFRADTSEVSNASTEDAMNALKRTVERRINTFGVSEPIIQVEKGGVFSDAQNENRLIVELPGITDVSAALDAIGKTPVLEFRLLNEQNTFNINIEEENPEAFAQQIYNSYEFTGLGGAQLERAQVVFDQLSSAPYITVKFNNEGADLFAKITKENVGREMGIFLDGQLLSSPVIRQEIIGGTAQITGSFTPEEARDLAQDLNLGALPVPIELIETQTIGPSLGQETLDSSVKAFGIAFGLITLFLLFVYRLPGLIAVVPLSIYVLLMFASFKVIPVTLTASGLAGFILSLGMAVDANVLIFERIKEELKSGINLKDAVINGFNRAWLPIRDGNISSLISAAVLYWLSDAAVIKGFALVFGIGVLISMLTAILVTRTLLLSIVSENSGDKFKKLFGYKK